ncbi:MAG: tRNA (adenosine(37)-N6)-threonylcarbamoyltransferase complex ATPase subunit type 1 TsaE [Gammaproteobacteria bacterium]
MIDATFTKYLPDESATLAFGSQVAILCPPATILFLYGNLGAGKTTFSRGFLRGLGYEGTVKSPTYTLVEPYQFKDVIVYHFDFYRLHDVQELEYIGIQDYFTQTAICLIEWPDNGAGMLPPADLSCYIEPIGSGREIKLIAHSAKGKDILKWLRNEK